MVTPITLVPTMYQYIMWEGDCLRFQHSQLGDSDDCFSPLAVCMISPSIRNVSKSEWGFWINSSLVFPWMMAYKSGNFSNRALVMLKSITNSIGSILWCWYGEYGIPLANDLISCYPFLVYTLLHIMSN